MGGIERAGSWDPGALLLAGPMKVRDLFVEARQVVRDGNLLTLPLDMLIATQQRLVSKLME